MPSNSVKNNNSETASLEIVELFPTPTHIFVADRPPNLEGKVESIAIKEAVPRFNMNTWTESLVIGSDFVANIKSNAKYLSENSVQIIFDEIQKNTQKIVICPQEKIGNGAFALEDLPENTWIAAYSANLQPIHDEQAFIDNKHSVYSVSMGNIEEPYVYDATLMGGVARFFQHLPEENNLYVQSKKSIYISDYEFNDTDTKNKVATANLEPINCIYKNKYPLVLFKTKIAPMNAKRLPDGRKVAVEKGQILGWDYGISYWGSHKINPSLMDKDGDVIPSDLYQLNKVTLAIRYQHKGKDCVLYNTMKKSDLIYSLSVAPLRLQLETVAIELGIVKHDYVEALRNSTNPLVISIDKPSYIKDLRVNDANLNEKIVIERLNQITEQISDAKWFCYYNVPSLAEKDTAVQKRIEEYFRSQELAVQKCLHPKTGEWVICVFEPDVNQVEAIKPLEVLSNANVPICTLTN